MSFTFTNYPILTPEQQNPMNALITRAMDTFGKGMKLSYAPKQMEADIFAKEIGPLAALASSPNFTGFNPQVQKMIADRISGYLGGHGGGGEAGASQGGRETPGYAGDEDIFGRLKKGADVALSPGGASKVGKSRFAGEFEKFGVPKAVSELLGGSEAAGESAAFEQAIDEGVKKLTLKGYSAQEAKKILSPKQGETNAAYLKRVKPLFVNQDEEAPITSIEQKIARDEQERAQYGQGNEEITEPEGAATLMETPDGQQWFVPVGKIKDAIKMGAKEVK